MNYVGLVLLKFYSVFLIGELEEGHGFCAEMKWNEYEVSIGRVLAVEVCTSCGSSLYIFVSFIFWNAAAICISMLILFWFAIFSDLILFFFFTSLVQSVRLYMKLTINNIFWVFPEARYYYFLTKESALKHILVLRVPCAFATTPIALSLA